MRRMLLLAINQSDWEIAVTPRVARLRTVSPLAVWPSPVFAAHFLTALVVGGHAGQDPAWTTRIEQLVR